MKWHVDDTIPVTESQALDITIYEDHDLNLAIPHLTEVPKEWADGWWLEKTQKTRSLICPFISNLMVRFDDNDMYSKA